MLGVQETRGSPEAYAERRHDRPATLVPRPDQVEAVEAVLERLESGGTRTQLRKACGTGKTLDGVKVLEGLDQPTNLLLFPSLGLIAQTLDVHRAQASTSRDYLVVCSDPSVVRRVSDDAAHYTSEDLGIQVTSDPAIVRQFLSSGSGQKVVLGTYQSGEVIAEAQKAMRLGGRASAFGFAAFDEAHHCTGIEGGQFTRPLDDAFIHADRRLFMTATPRIYTERAKSREEAAGNTLLSMDDFDRFGDVAYSLPFSRAIGMGLLTPYEVLVVAVNEKEIPGLKIEAGKPKLSGRELSEDDLHRLASYVALQKAMTEYDLKRVISFHSSVSRAKRFADQTRPDSFHAAATAISQRFGAELWTQAVDGSMPASERKELLGRMRNLPAGMRAVFSNCRCLGEGIDVPTLDAVCFIDDRRSVTDLVQAVGRAIRKAPDKHVGRVILAVFVPSGTDAESVVEASSFRKVWQVLRALQAHDDTLTDTLDALRRSGTFQQGGAGERGLPVRLEGQCLPVTLLRDLDRALAVTAVNRMALAPLTEELIRRWVLDEFKSTGKWPNTWSGKVQVVGVDEWWPSLNGYLGRGGRGLPGGQSLTNVVADVRRAAGMEVVLTEGLIKQWIRAEYEKTKRWPLASYGAVQVDGVKEKWSNLHLNLLQGRRGLPSGKRLADLVEEVRAEFGQSSTRTMEEVRRLIWQHYCDRNEWPHFKSKVPVTGGLFTSWSALNQALWSGRFGLPGGSSLAKVVELVKEEHGLSDKLTLHKVRSWVLTHHDRTGRWPSAKSGLILAGDADGMSWANLDDALSRGLRGLQGSSSLAKVVKEVRSDFGDPYELTLNHIKWWMQNEFIATGSWRMPDDGRVHSPGVSMKTWRIVRAALSEGSRGLPKGTSFAQLRREAQEEYVRRRNWEIM